jgi:hypothetical protein
VAKRTIVCVLKTGGWRNRHMAVEYTPDNVRWLRDQLPGKVGCDYRFVCLSDVPIAGVDVIPLRDALPGWWSKMELFREFAHAFYVDLDTVIVGNITKMVRHRHEFTVLRNLTRPESGQIGSGLMAWSGDYSRLYRAFMADPDRHMAECVTTQKWGDQGFIQSKMQRFDYFQDLFPGAVVSYKADLLKVKDPGLDCRIVCFHGAPKPFDVRHSWVPPRP